MSDPPSGVNNAAYARVQTVGSMRLIRSFCAVFLIVALFSFAPRVSSAAGGFTAKVVSVNKARHTLVVAPYNAGVLNNKLLKVSTSPLTKYSFSGPFDVVQGRFAEIAPNSLVYISTSTPLRSTTKSVSATKTSYTIER